jgi:hypothetical protein
VDLTFAMAARNPDAPRIAAHFAVLNEAADDVGLDVDFEVLPAVRTRHSEPVVHGPVLYKEREDTRGCCKHASSNGDAESDSGATGRGFLSDDQHLHLSCDVLEQLSGLAVSLLQAGQSLIDTVALAFFAAAGAKQEGVCRREHDGSVFENGGPRNHATSSVL